MLECVASWPNVCMCVSVSAVQNARVAYEQSSLQKLMMASYFFRTFYSEWHFCRWYGQCTPFNTCSLSAHVIKCSGTLTSVVVRCFVSSSERQKQISFYHSLSSSSTSCSQCFFRRHCRGLASAESIWKLMIKCVRTKNNFSFMLHSLLRWLVTCVDEPKRHAGNFWMRLWIFRYIVPASVTCIVQMRKGN